MFPDGMSIPDELSHRLQSSCGEQKARVIGPLSQFNQNLARLHAFANLDKDGFYLAGGMRHHRCLHFHRLDDRHAVASVNLLPKRHKDRFDNAAECANDVAGGGWTGRLRRRWGS